MGCVYIAINKVNGKCYVGKTVKTIKTRRSWHESTSQRGEGWSFHRAIKKYGKESFTWEILETSDDPEKLGTLEIEFIISKNSKSPNGYNLTDGGDGVVGKTPESIEKTAEFHRGRKRSVETRERISNSAKGKQKRLGAILSKDTKQKISKSNKGKIVTEETRKKIGNYQAGRPKTEEQKGKMSKSRIKWWEAKWEKEAQEKSKQPSLFDMFGTKEPEEASEDE